MDELDKIRELIFSGVDHNIELGIIMAHGLNISLDDTLGELLKSEPFGRSKIEVFNTTIVVDRIVIRKRKPRRKTTYKTERRVSLRSPKNWTETFFNIEIDTAVKKLLIIFKNKIDELQSE